MIQLRIIRSAVLLLPLLCACPGPWTLPVESEEGGILLAAWSDGSDLLAVGGHLDDSGGLIVRREGDAWCKEPGFADRPLWWVHGSTEGRWFAVGAAGLILHREGGQLVDESVDTVATLYGVWDEGDRVWAVGGDVFGSRLGEIWLREDGEWSLFASDLPGVVFKVWERWFVGDGVALYLGDDGLLENRSTGGGEKLLTVRGRSDTDVWAVGGAMSSLLMHHDGTEWSTIEVDPLCTSQPLNGVWTAPGEDVWVAGMSGAMARFDGQEWHCAKLREDDPLRDLNHAHFHAVWPGTEGEMLWFGGDFFERGDNLFTIGRHSETPGTTGVGTCGS